MPYLYDGALSKDCADYVAQMFSKYPYVLELTEVPEHTWIAENFKVFEYADCWSVSGRTRKSHQYGAVRKAEGDNVFMFFACQEDRNKVLAEQARLVVNEKPFQTIVG